MLPTYIFERDHLLNINEVVSCFLSRVPVIEQLEPVVNMPIAKPSEKRSMPVVLICCTEVCLEDVCSFDPFELNAPH